MAEDSIQEQLDAKVVDYFNTLDNLFCCQKELEDHMKEGFFNMSKARYSMGVKAVGALQFDGRNMKALTKVDVNDKSNGDDLFTLIKNQTANGASENEGRSSGSGVRKRGSGKGSESTEENFDDMDWINDQIKKMGLSLDGLDPKPKPKVKPVQKQDPLKWFGVLVPQTLRSSQSHFQQATDLGVEIVNLRHKLFDIRDQYLALKQDKLDQTESTAPLLEL